MRSEIRPGPQPWRKRLQELDIEALGEGLRALVSYARGQGEAVSVPARELAEAVVVAHQASVARAALARGLNVMTRDLAALAGVTPTRVRQLVAAGILKRDGALVTAESAMQWLELRGARTPVKAHRLVLEPSWWSNRLFNKRHKVLEQLIAILATFAPAEATIDRYGWEPKLLIPREANCDVATAERIKAEILAWLEAHDPGE